jgi:hypothetical protein
MYYELFKILVKNISKSNQIYSICEIATSKI